MEESSPYRSAIFKLLGSLGNPVHCRKSFGVRVWLDFDDGTLHCCIGTLCGRQAGVSCVWKALDDKAWPIRGKYRTGSTGSGLT